MRFVSFESVPSSSSMSNLPFWCRILLFDWFGKKNSNLKHLHFFFKSNNLRSSGVFPVWQYELDGDDRHQWRIHWTDRVLRCARWHVGLVHIVHWAVAALCRRSRIVVARFRSYRCWIRSVVVVVSRSVGCRQWWIEYEQQQQRRQQTRTEDWSTTTKQVFF